MAKLIHVRKPRLRLGPGGLKLSRPSARIGGKVGLNLSSRGVSASARTKVGTISTRKAGGSRRKKKAGAAGCVLPALIVLAALVAAIATML